MVGAGWRFVEMAEKAKVNTPAPARNGRGGARTEMFDRDPGKAARVSRLVEKLRKNNPEVGVETH